MARNQPGQNGGNQGPIFSVHIAALSTHEMEDPSNALASSNRDRLMHALYPANSQTVASRKKMFLDLAIVRKAKEVATETLFSAARDLR